MYPSLERIFISALILAIGLTVEQEMGILKVFFKYKKGDCRDYTAFSVYCLKKAGYDARVTKVVSPTGRSYHIVCKYKAKGKEYIMDNSCPMCGSGKGITEKQLYIKDLPQIGVGYQ